MSRFSIAEHTIFLTLAGSQAHGTAREDSDRDVRGVCRAPLRTRLSLFEGFEQYEGELPADLEPKVAAHFGESLAEVSTSGTKVECAIFDLAKFVALCAAANPNALEILFADERDWILATPVWRHLHERRGAFLTRKVQQTFLGYGLAQLKRIRTHRAWLLEPPRNKPSREDFGLSADASGLSRDDRGRLEATIDAQLRSLDLDGIEMADVTRVQVRARWREALGGLLAVGDEDLDGRLRERIGGSVGIPTGVMATLDAERRYQAAMKQWESYQNWLGNRNPKRAELERRFGYDTKHAMHLIRLMRMGCEILERGVLEVRRKDAAELVTIRDGALSFEQLLEHAGALQAAMEKASAACRLPADVDRAEIDELTYELLTTEITSQG